MTDLMMIGCFLILFVREQSHRKKTNADKNVVQ